MKSRRIIDLPLDHPLVQESLNTFKSKEGDILKCKTCGTDYKRGAWNFYDLCNPCLSDYKRKQMEINYKWACEQHEKLEQKLYDNYLKNWKPERREEYELSWMEQEKINDRPLPKEWFLAKLEKDKDFRAVYGLNSLKEDI